jgi:hypothetical protein
LGGLAGLAGYLKGQIDTRAEEGECIWQGGVGRSGKIFLNLKNTFNRKGILTIFSPRNCKEG